MPDYDSMGVTNGDSVLQSGFDLACLDNSFTTLSDTDHDLDHLWPTARTHARESLTHFVQCNQSWLKSAKVQRILQKDAVGIVMDYPYLLHSVIALSAAHLAYLNPAKKSYRLASLVHWQHSLRSYSRCFASDIMSQNSPAIYFANMMQAILSFLYSRLPLPGEDDTRPNWVVTMQGKKIILDMPHVVERLDQTIWKPLVQAHDQWQERSSTRLIKIRNDLPNIVIQALLDYSRTQPVRRAIVYEERIYFLAMLEHVPPITDAIGGHASFIAEAPAPFVQLLKNGDSFALLLLFHWIRMFARLEQWWIAGPAAIERDRLYDYLVQHADDNIRHLLAMLVPNPTPEAMPAQK